MAVAKRARILISTWALQRLMGLPDGVDVIGIGIANAQRQELYVEVQGDSLPVPPVSECDTAPHMNMTVRRRQVGVGEYVTEFLAFTPWPPL